VSRDGTLWAMPYAVENIALIRNTSMVPDPPSTMEELVAVGEEVVAGSGVTHVLALPMGMTGDAYHAYPIYATGGGYLVRPGDPADVGVDSPGGITAFSKLRELGEHGRGVLLRSVTHDTAIPLFASERAAFLISGPWAVPRLRRAGTPYAVSPIPAFAGGPPATPLIGVPAAYLAKGGRNRELARHVLTEVLCRADVATLIYRAEPRPPAQPGMVADLDEDTTNFQEAGRHGVVMLSGPAMIRVFDVFGRAIAACVAGAPAESTALGAAREIRRLLDVAPDAIPRPRNGAG
ncbi:MAG TPA: extracellular solute-binding protein, partial [Micromonosporaceae bacterium]|nr:extracellular solute-binding protein [Micromonosporaceae bacterium]